MPVRIELWCPLTSGSGSSVKYREVLKLNRGSSFLPLPPSSAARAVECKHRRLMTCCDEGIRRDVVEAVAVRARFGTAGLLAADLSKSSVILDEDAAMLG